MDFLRENGIDVDGSIEILGDIEMVNELLGDFLVEMDERMPLLKEYKDNGDMENYAVVVHAIKSDAKYLGFVKLAEMALEHQLKAQDGNGSYVDDHYDELMEEIERIIKVVTEYRGM